MLDHHAIRQPTSVTKPSSDRLQILYILGPISPREWLQRALLDGAAKSIDVTATPSLMVGLERLREQPFDVVVIDRDASDRPAAELLLAIQASTHEHQSVLILSDGEDRQEATDYLLAGAVGFLSLNQTTTQELVWQLYSAAQHARLEIENHRLRSWQERYREQEQREVLSLLEEQSTIFGVAARLREDPVSAEPSDRREVSTACRELLQAYVVMGRGQIADEVQRLADRLHEESFSLARTLHAFTQALQSLVRDRGARSSRHVFNRGNLLLLDLLLKWADHSSVQTAPEKVAPEKVAPEKATLGKGADGHLGRRSDL